MIICVDMDYGSDPVWVGEIYQNDDNEEIIGFANDTLQNYKGILGDPVLHSLELLMKTWDCYYTSKYQSFFSPEIFPGKLIMCESINTLMYLCAAQIKKEKPEWRVFYASMYNYKRKELK